MTRALILKIGGKSGASTAEKRKRELKIVGLQAGRKFKALKAQLAAFHQTQGQIQLSAADSSAIHLSAVRIL